MQKRGFRAKLMGVVLLLLLAAGMAETQAAEPAKAIPDRDFDRLMKALEEANQKTKETYRMGEMRGIPLEKLKEIEERYRAEEAKILKGEGEQSGQGEKAQAEPPASTKQVPPDLVSPPQEEKANPFIRRAPRAPSKATATAPVSLRGGLTEKEIKKLKERALKYRELVSSPPRVHPGKVCRIPYAPKPQEVRVAVGYATVVRFPFKLRRENPTVVGDAGSFTVTPLNDRELVIFAKKPFWTSNIIVFPEKQGEEAFPVLLFVREAYSTGDGCYFVEVVAPERGLVLNEGDLLDLALNGSFSDRAKQELLSPVCTRGRLPVRSECVFGGEGASWGKVMVYEGRWECLKGCRTWLYADRYGLSVFEVPKGVAAEICEVKNSSFAPRRCAHVE